MSVSDHPIALRLERQVGGATKLLATVMGLPLVDGIFPALVIANALTNPWGILQTGLLIFGGSATVAVILAEMEGSPTEKATSVLLLGAVLVPVAVAEAALAQTLQSLLNFGVFHRFAGLVILAIAAKTASAEVGEYLPSPGAIVGLGLVASVRADAFDPFVLQVTADPTMLAHAGAAAGTGIGFALAVALGAPHLQGVVDIDRFRFGSSVALGMLAMDVLGVLQTEQPVALGVLAVTALLSYDPGDADAAEAAAPAGEGETAEQPPEVAVDGYPTGHPAEPETATADGGTEELDAETDAAADGEREPERPPYL